MNKAGYKVFLDYSIFLIWMGYILHPLWLQIGFNFYSLPPSIQLHCFSSTLKWQIEEMNSVTNSHAVKFTPQLVNRTRLFFQWLFLSTSFRGAHGSQWVSGTGLVYGFWPTASSSGPCCVLWTPLLPSTQVGQGAMQLIILYT
jgi:hypothetical protein